MVGRKVMTPEHSPVPELPAMPYGSITAVRRKVLAEGYGWAREYLETSSSRVLGHG